MKELLRAGARIAIGENPMKEIEKRSRMDPEIIRMMNKAWSLEAPDLDYHLTKTSLGGIVR